MKTPPRYPLLLLLLLFWLAGPGCTGGTSHYSSSWSSGNPSNEPLSVVLDQWMEEDTGLPYINGAWSPGSEDEGLLPGKEISAFRLELFRQGGRGHSTVSTYGNLLDHHTEWLGDDGAVIYWPAYTLYLDLPKVADDTGKARIRFNEDYLGTLTTLVTFEAPGANLETLLFTPISLEFTQEITASMEAVTFEELLQLRRSGVSATYVRELTPAGYTFDGDDIVRLRRSGVSSFATEALQQGGFQPYPVTSLLAFAAAVSHPKPLACFGASEEVW